MKINKTDIYKAVKEEKQKDSTVSVSSVLKKIDVSRSGFYDYLKRVPSKTKLRKERITKEIKKIHCYLKNMRIIMQFMHLHIFLKYICVKNNCQKKYIVYHKEI